MSGVTKKEKNGNGLPAEAREALTLSLAALCSFCDQADAALYKKFDSELYLTLGELFGVGHIDAWNGAHSQDYATFASNLLTLETVVGMENAADVVRNGKFLSYRNGFRDEFFRLARIAAGKLGKDLAPYISIFYSIESLNEYLKPKQDAGTFIDVKNLNAQHYRLFFPDDAQARKYLVQLIEHGQLTPGDNEHWGTLRGGDIVRVIVHEFHRAEKDLGLRGLEFRHGKGTLYVSDSTRDILKDLRDQFYARRQRSN